MIIKRFKLYPDCHWVYYEVFIHDTREAMRKANPGNDDADGLCRGWLTGHVPSGKIRPKLGEIHLFDKKPGFGISTHEICHAVFRYFGVRRDFKLDWGMIGYSSKGGMASHREEAFCWVMGNMARQFVINFHQKTQFRPGPQNSFSPIKRTMRCATFQ